MLSVKLIQLIENHSDQIARAVLHRIHHDPRTPHMARLPEGELRDHCHEILKKLGHWLAESKEEEVASHFQELGRLRAAEAVPLHEAVHALHVLKTRMLDYVRDQGFAQTSVDLYAEEELEHQIGRFFDSVVYHLVKGYESSFKKGAGGQASAL